MIVQAAIPPRQAPILAVDYLKMRLDESVPKGTGSSQALGFVLACAMPTVPRIGGLRVVIYPNDHRPPRVHVWDAGSQAVFVLNGPAGPPTLRGSFGFTTGELNRIRTALAENLFALCEEWERIHDDHRP